MTSYAIGIYECPHCGSTFVFLTLASWTSYGAKVYTDGFIGSSTYVQSSALVRCPQYSCSKYLWMSDLKKVASMGESEYYHLANRATFSTARGIADAEWGDVLRRRPWRSAEEEKHARIQALWYFNAPYREQNAAAFLPNEVHEANLRRLLDLIHARDSDELLMKAEILRELGEFRECIEMLSEVGDEHLAKAAGCVRRLAKEGERRVALVA